ncbi:unnamed protein product [Rhizopus microsporus]
MYCLRRTYFRFHFSKAIRYSSSRFGLDERTKKVMEEIKQIEYQLQSRSKQAASLPEKVSNEEIETIYKELSAPTPPRPKITSNYWNNYS